MKGSERHIAIGSKQLAVALLVFAAFGSGATQAETRQFLFEILRNGKPIGEHQLEIERKDNETRVVAQSTIDVTLLGFTIYRMRYQAEERWDEQGIRDLWVEVDDDGRQMRITGQRRDNQFHWSGIDGREQRLSMPVFTTNHWNPNVIEADRVLNTLTGQMNQVKIEPVHDGAAKTTRSIAETDLAVYRYNGDLNIQSWYDQEGQWHGLRFKGRDGSDIEYVCRNCAESTIL